METATARPPFSFFSLQSVPPCSNCQKANYYMARRSGVGPCEKSGPKVGTSESSRGGRARQPSLSFCRLLVRSSFSCMYTFHWQHLHEGDQLVVSKAPCDTDKRTVGRGVPRLCRGEATELTGLTPLCLIAVHSSLIATEITARRPADRHAIAVRTERESVYKRNHRWTGPRVDR